MSGTIGKVANGQLTDRFAKAVAVLRQIPPLERLNLLAGGLIATADELGLTPAQVDTIVRTAMAQRAAVLERMRQGEKILFGPDGSPLVPTLAGSVASSDEPPTVDESPTAKLGAPCRCVDMSDGFPRPPGDYDHEPACPRFAVRPTPKAPEPADPGALCAFCGHTEAEGRHDRSKLPHTWHAFRAAVTEQEKESAARAQELRRPPA